MENATNAIKSFIGRSGHHDTHVDETVNPAVTQETVKPTRHEETQQAVDREVHKDHYHTTVQPVQHQEVKPDKHLHRELPVEEREIVHGDSRGIGQTVANEAAQFKDTSVTSGTAHSSSVAPTVEGEHVHHHVHENVQPIIHKEKIVPEVVHTTQPIHELHQAPSEHHGISTLPTKSLTEFQSQGGSLTGSANTREEYEGDPRPYNPAYQNERHDVDKNFKAHDGLHGSGAATSATGGLNSGNTSTGGIGARDLNTGDIGSSTTRNTGTSGMTGATGAAGAAGAGVAAAEGLAHHNSDNYRLNDPRGQAGSGTTTKDNVLGGHTQGGTPGQTVGSGLSGSNPMLEGGNNNASTDYARNTTSYPEPSSNRDQTTRVPGTVGGVAAATTAGSNARDGESGREAVHESSGGHHSLKDKLPGHHNNRKEGTSDALGQPDVQRPGQGKDPSLVGTDSADHKLTGQGADGSHSAVFGLTPDGHKYDDTHSGTTKLKKTPTDDSSGQDSSSRAATGGGVAEQMHNPRVAEKGHGGPAVSDEGTNKIGAGAQGGSQGFGQVRPEEHGTGNKLKDKLDPSTDADNDGRKGVAD